MWARGRRAGPTPPAGRGYTLAGAPVGTKDRKAVLTLALVTANVDLSREKHPSLQHPPPPSICCPLCLACRPTTDSTASRDVSAAPAFQKRESVQEPRSCVDRKLSSSDSGFIFPLRRPASPSPWIAQGRPAALLVASRCRYHTFCCCLRPSVTEICAAVCGWSLCSFSLVCHGTAHPAMQAPSSG